MSSVPSSRAKTVPEPASLNEAPGLAAAVRLGVLVETPQHSGLIGPLDYVHVQDLPVGTLVRVPLGKRETLGVVWDAATAEATGEFDPAKVRDIAGVLEGIPPLSRAWQQLLSFTAAYYQRSAGEVALAALPPQLREFFQVTLYYAHKHREVIAQYGRFPHRNPILGRESTAAEKAYLSQPGAGF